MKVQILLKLALIKKSLGCNKNYTKKVVVKGKLGIDVSI